MKETVCLGFYFPGDDNQRIRMQLLTTNQYMQDRIFRLIYLMGSNLNWHDNFYKIMTELKQLSRSGKLRFNLDLLFAHTVGYVHLSNRSPIVSQKLHKTERD